MEDNDEVYEMLKMANVGVLTNACDQLCTIARLNTFWLPKLCKLQVSFLLFCKNYILMMDNLLNII